MANRFTDLVFEITALKSTQKIVLWVLAHRADENGRCFPSYKNIAKHAGVHKRTAALTIQELLTMEPRVLALIENYDGRDPYGKKIDDLPRAENGEAAVETDQPLGPKRGEKH